MVFNSPSYFFFLPVVYLIFYFTADRWRWLVLLVASYGFYATFKAPYLLAVLVLVTGISYVCGLRIGAQQKEADRKRWLWIGVVTIVAILALLKYLPFLEVQAKGIFGLKSTHSALLISIGVSYYTFQAISYLIDIYLEVGEPEKHLGHYALYLAFFPKLLQGPIERLGDLLPQLKENYEFNYDNMRFGLLLFAWGLFKKLIVADRIGHYVNAIYGDVSAISGLPLLLTVYAYSFQIYLDFSAYIDMALGSARLFNINLTQNFNSPYLATSVADFWRRWHISFSRWILDYIFKPLQMQWRNGKSWGTASALVVTFLVSGLWHGASWGFVAWGGLHGLFMACAVFYRPYQKKLHKALRIDKTWVLKVWQIFVTFNLVSFAWVFFRAKDLREAILIFTNLFSLPARSVTSGYHEFIRSIFADLGITNVGLVILLFNLFILFIVSYLRLCEFPFQRLAKAQLLVRWSFYLLVLMLIICFTQLEYIPFLYIQY